MSSRIPLLLCRAGAGAGSVLLFSWLAACGTSAGGAATTDPTLVDTGGSGGGSGDVDASGDTTADTTADATTDGSGATGEACGNGVRELGEACDDGNTTGGDGCEADCTVTSGAACAPCATSADCGSVAPLCGTVGAVTACLANCDAVSGCGDGFVCSPTTVDGVDRAACIPATGSCSATCADADGDTICDQDDICAAGDDRIDTDGDGTPDACEGIELCTNGIDDDTNGLVDCFDAACAADPACAIVSREICANLIDDDRNGLTDCADPICAAEPGCVVLTEVCGNGLDDDGNGFTDCADAACASAPGCIVISLEVCGNGIDDDGNGRIDCADPACSTDPGCAVVGPEICGNGLDDDRNGRIDCADGACATDPSCVIGPEICSNGIDDDRNGFTDCGDVACAADPACAPSSEICNDLIDNDGDRLIDCGDPDCAADPACPTGPQLCTSPNLFGAFGSRTGATSTLADNQAGSCAVSDGPETVYSFTATAAGTLCARTFGSSYDTVLYVRTACTDAASEVACNDDATFSQQSQLAFTAVAGQQYFFFVDGFTGASGSYALTLSAGACPARAREICTDGVDNDFDLFTDCADTDCAADPACIVTPEDCQDGLDNDRDTFVDCDDADCSTFPTCIPEALCDNGIDDDGDGTIDCFDLDCLGDVACPTLEICDDSADNDGDGLIDCDDPECIATPGCAIAAQTCADPNVSDGYGSFFGLTDALTDNYDPGCARSAAPEAVWRFNPPATGTVCINTVGSAYDTVLYARTNCGSTRDLACNDDTLGQQSEIQLDVTTGTPVYLFIDGFNASTGGYRLTIAAGACTARVETLCTDGLDNDGDGNTDCNDNDCNADPACAPVPETICNDRIDNDRDGRTDCFDTDCNGNPACIETICNDRIDNDNDGRTDCFDTDCAADPACAPVPETICNDGRDNDGDGQTDCADSDCFADPVCVAAVDGTCNGPYTLDLAASNSGTIAAGGSNRTGTCGGGGTPEQVWTLGAPVTTASDLCVTVTATGFTPIIYDRDDTCTQRAGEQVCVAGTGGTASMTVALQPGVVPYIIVDGGPGAYTVTTAAGACP